MPYFKEHWTLSQWLAESPRVDALVEEDAAKRGRLEVLRREASVPSVSVVRYPYGELLEGSDVLDQLAREAGADLYALRLNPVDGGEVHRERGRPVTELVDWARGLGLPRDSYECVFERHVESIASAIFICSASGMWGEFHDGPLLELNRGSVEGDVIQFNGAWDAVDDSLPGLVRQAADALAIVNADTRDRLTAECDSRFAGVHLLGYFEVIADSAGSMWFVDYNRLLVEDAPEGLRTERARGSGVALRGRTGSRGSGRGPVVHAPDEGSRETPERYVLVASATRPELIGIMSGAEAVVTEVGGVLSHAAIACRELGIPCVVGVRGARSALPEGTEVVVDADEGTVAIVNPLADA